MGSMVAGEVKAFFQVHRIGDGWARPLTAPVQDVMRRIVRPIPKTGQVLPVEYHRTPFKMDNAATWPRLKSPDANRLLLRSSAWRYAACLAFEGADILYSAYKREQTRAAFLRVARSGAVIAGLLPEEAIFGTHTPSADCGDSSPRSLLMYRTDPRGVTDVVTPAIYVGPRLFIPHETTVLAVDVPLAEASRWGGASGIPIV